MLELAVLTDGGRLAIAVSLRAVDAERGDCLLRQQFAELLADRDQWGEVFDIAAGKGIFDHRDRRSAARRRRDRLAHLQMGLFDDSHDLANDGTHRCSSRSSLHKFFEPAIAARSRTNLACLNQPRFALQLQRGAFNQSRGQQPARAVCTGLQRVLNFTFGQCGDVPRHQPRAEITVRLQLVRGPADARRDDRADRPRSR